MDFAAGLPGPAVSRVLCCAAKEQLDRNDEIVIDKDGNFPAGTWFCKNGHANKI